MRRRKPLPEAPAGSGRLLDARLHILDRQLLDFDDTPVGIVDDLLLEDLADDGRGPRVLAILTGQVLATRIFGGKPPVSRLQKLPWRLVRSVGIVVRVDADTDGGTGSLDNLWVERWLRDHVIAHIPGRRHAAH